MPRKLTPRCACGNAGSVVRNKEQICARCDAMERRGGDFPDTSGCPERLERAFLDMDRAATAWLLRRGIPADSDWTKLRAWTDYYNRGAA